MCIFLCAVLQADYLQPKLLGILAFFNMQLLSSSAGEKDRKKLVGLRRLRTNSKCKVSVCQCLPVFLPAGVDKRDGSDAPDGLQTHQLRAGQDDDDAAHGTALQRGFPSALLPVSSYTNTQTRKHCVNDIRCILVKPDIIIIIYHTTN